MQDQNEEENYDFEDKTETQSETSKEHPKDEFHKVAGARNDRNRLQKSLGDKQEEPIGSNGLEEKRRDESTKRPRQKENKDSKDEKSQMKTSKEHSERSSREKRDRRDSSLMEKRSKKSRRLQERNPNVLVNNVAGPPDEVEKENRKLKKSVKQLEEEIAELKKQMSGLPDIISREKKWSRKPLEDEKGQANKLKRELEYCREELERIRTENTELHRQLKEWEEEMVKLQQTAEDKEKELIEEIARCKEELGRRSIVVSLTDLPKPKPPREGTPHKSNPLRHRRIKTTPPCFFHPQNVQTKDLSSIRSNHNITGDPQMFNLSDGPTAEKVHISARALENGGATSLPVKNSEIVM